MKVYETTATVENHGHVRVADVPFAPGTEVEVTISPKRRSAEEFTAAWAQVCGRLRSLPRVQSMSEDDVQQEIDAYRAGQ